jgi:hypothetical protein
VEAVPAMIKTAVAACTIRIPGINLSSVIMLTSEKRSPLGIPLLA